MTANLKAVREAVCDARDAARDAAIAVKRLIAASAALDRLAASIQQALTATFPSLDIRVSGPMMWMLDCGRTEHGLERFVDISDRDFPRPSYNVWVVASNGFERPWLTLGKNLDGDWCWVDQFGEPSTIALSIDAETFQKACVEISLEINALVGVLYDDLVAPSEVSP